MHTGIDVSEYRAFYDKQRKKIIFFAGRLSDAKGARVVEKAMQIISQAILDGVTGYVVNPFDIKTMAEKIMGLLRDEEMAERFGRAGRERVESKFNIDDKIAEFLNTIKDG